MRFAGASRRPTMRRRPPPREGRSQMKPMNRIALLATSALALGACAKHEAQHPLADGPPISVAVAPAHEEALAVLYRASGTVRGRNTTTLTSKTMGYVRAVRVHAGDRV